MKFKAPKSAATVNWSGKEFKVEKGHVELPAEAQADLKPHGFEPVKAEADKDTEAK